MGDEEVPVTIHAGSQTNNRVERTYQPPDANAGSLEPADIQLAVRDKQLTEETPSSTTKYKHPKAEDIVHKMIKDNSYTKVQWFWMRYVQWWYRMPIMVVLAMYWLMVLDNLVTLRHHQTARFYTSPTTKQGDPNQLPDLLLDIGYINNSSADAFVSATPAIAIVGMLLVVIFRRKYAVMAEIVWVESIMLFLIALTQIMTGYPEPNPKKPVCWISEYDTYGSWVWQRVATTFCGDCMWSGHTYHTLFGWIMIYRHFWPALIARLNIWVYTFLFWAFFGSWFIIFEFCLLGTHYHYTSDVIVSITITIFLCTNRAVLAPGIAFLYPVLRPTEIYIHLLPENYKRLRTPEQYHAEGLGQYI